MIRQTIFHLSEKRRGCHLVPQEIIEHIPKPLPQVGMLNLFVQHTSCALSINENYGCQDIDGKDKRGFLLDHIEADGTDSDLEVKSSAICQNQCILRERQIFIN